MLNRYSSRKCRMDESFLNQKLNGASSYDRIAGYFSSSILEVAGESIENVTGKVRIICNSTLNPEDIKIAGYANLRIKQEWCEGKPEEKYTGEKAATRLQKLYNLLTSGKLEVRVIPNEIFGLVHGKAGVITYPNGEKTCFIGSINETKNAYTCNYEIAWEDTSEESIEWVQDEFDYFWKSKYAVPLSDAVIKDIDRISRRTIIPLKDWREEDAEKAVGSAAVEEPVCRNEFGLWEHQKYFVERAFREHKEKGGARLLLADMVGLGKTIQLAMSAKLMGLYGDKPILIIVPKTLTTQWQEEMKTLLDMPSAIWTNKGWVDENGYTYYSSNPEDIKHCPRKIGIISQGLITHGSDVVGYLRELQYECVILDEAHRARRANGNKDPEKYRAEPNKLLEFINFISTRTKSMLLATATPVQINPIEVFDLINALGSSRDAEKVIGNTHSIWRKEPQTTLSYVSGESEAPDIELEEMEAWNLLRNPFPQKSDGNDVAKFRDRLDIKDETSVLSVDYLNDLSPSNRDRIIRFYRDSDYVIKFNPYIRNIIRRTRKLLEETINPDTGEPFLKKIDVELYGEKDDEALKLYGSQYDAYKHAEEFCALLSNRVRGGGFMSTLLLKRIGSTMIAGENTAKKMLKWTAEGNEALSLLYNSDEEDEDDEEIPATISDIKNLTTEEVGILKQLVEVLSENKATDPKYIRLCEILKDGVESEGGWKDKGCILFSQYYDSARYVAELLSKEFPESSIGLYAGGTKSGIFTDGKFETVSKDEIKRQVKTHQIKILVGTDAASEGLNLQTLSTLINIDLPWNPTRLEQRKGRIQRIGQVSDNILIYNMRYKDSVEDKVHEKLSSRLQEIFNIFGQVPDMLEDVWVAIALNDEKRAEEAINKVPKKHPFELKYELQPANTGDWLSCSLVLSKEDKAKAFLKTW